jgi:hypothetical protein
MAVSRKYRSGPVRSALAVVLLLTLGSLGRISLPAQGPRPEGLHSIPGETAFSTILRVAKTYETPHERCCVVWSGTEGKADLYSCGSLARDVIDEDDPYYELTDLAIWINLLSRELKVEGIYPAGAPYLNRLIQYGEAETVRIKANPGESHSWAGDNEPLLEDLAAALNTALHSEKYTVEGGCGGGEVRILVKIPAGSAAMMINTFHFTLCQARGMDPWNAQACFGWKTVGQVPMLLAGAYRYVLTLTNGAKKIGDVVVNKQLMLNPSNVGPDSEYCPYMLNLR